MFILVVFFATSRFPFSQIVLGQCIGMGSLIGVSLAGSLITIVLPRNIIGLIGLFPIIIGIKELLELRKKGDDEYEKLTKKLLRSRKIHLSFLTVSAVTFSGGEEIGIYTTLFVVNNEVGAIIMLISVVMVLTTFWCFLANYLVKHSFLADIFRSIGVLSYVLIGLGIYILVEAFILV